MGYSEILLEENPYGYNPRGWYGSSRRHSRAAKKGHRRNNPMAKMPTTLKGFYQGVSPMDAAWALGGFAGSAMLPGMIIKDAVTTGQKLGKFVLALGSAGVVGLAGKSFGRSAGQAAIAGGLAGALAQGLAAFTNIQIGTIGNPRPARVNRRPIGTSTVVSPSFTREGETVSLITP